MRTDTKLPILDLRGKKTTTFIALEVASEIEPADVGVRLVFFTDDHVAIDSDLRA